MNALSPADTERLRQAFLRCHDMEGTLGAQLDAYAQAGREIFPAYIAAAYGIGSQTAFPEKAAAR
jgi:hypothetical protein